MPPATPTSAYCFAPGVRAEPTWTFQELANDHAAVVHQNYPAAGHTVLNSPYQPPFLYDGGQYLGGTAAADEAAHARDWPAMLAFIRSH